MKLIKDIPCKDCITFAVCNAQISKETPYSDVVDKLMPKCSLIQEHIKSSNYFSLDLIMKIAKFFRPRASFIVCPKDTLVDSLGHIIYIKKEYIHEVNN